MKSDQFSFWKNVRYKRTLFTGSLVYKPRIHRDHFLKIWVGFRLTLAYCKENVVNFRIAKRQINSPAFHYDQFSRFHINFWALIVLKTSVPRLEIVNQLRYLFFGGSPMERNLKIIWLQWHVAVFTSFTLPVVVYKIMHYPESIMLSGAWSLELF